MSNLRTLSPVCNECSGHGVVADPFGGLVACPRCDGRPATVTMTLVDMPALVNRLEALAADAAHRSLTHGATHERDVAAGVAQGLRQAAELLEELYGVPADLVELDELLAGEEVHIAPQGWF